MLVAKLNEHWRSSAVRFAFLYGILFVSAVAVLLFFIYWRTTLYLQAQTENALAGIAHNLSQMTDDELIIQIGYTIEHDVRHINLIGLFSDDGKPIIGNLQRIPIPLIDDGSSHPFSYDAALRHFVASPQYQRDINSAHINSESSNLRQLGNAVQTSGVGTARLEKLKSGKLLVVGRDITQMLEARNAIEEALFGGGSCILMIGLAGGFMLSRRPLRRINEIREVTQKIMVGNLDLRIPYSRHHDELDMLAETVNRTLDEIARLLVEVKSVTDTIAHDLRTPLTRLRARLYRTLQECEPQSRHYDMFEQALQETDTLLGRFRALLRIAEIENRQRRAGFIMVDLAHVMEQIHELFEPLAEEKEITLMCTLRSARPVMADPDLLFEALSNLVDNAIKFTLPGGVVELSLDQCESGPIIDIKDNGPGVAVNERDAIMRRFYRRDRDRAVPGYGLGLSIVNAIVLLHGFKLQFREAERGTHLSLYCWPHPIET